VSHFSEPAASGFLVEPHLGTTHAGERPRPCEPEVGERAVTVEVEDDPLHLAGVKQRRRQRSTRTRHAHAGREERPGHANAAGGLSGSSGELALSGRSRDQHPRVRRSAFDPLYLILRHRLLLEAAGDRLTVAATGGSRKQIRNHPLVYLYDSGP